MFAEFNLYDLACTAANNNALVNDHGEDSDNISQHHIIKKSYLRGTDMPEPDHREVIQASDGTDQDVVPYLDIIQSTAGFRLPEHRLGADGPRSDIPVISTGDYGVISHRQ